MLRPFITGLLISIVTASCTLPGIGSSTPRALRDAAPAPTAVPLTDAIAVTGTPTMFPHPISVPAGFTVSLYAENLGAARGIAVSPDGTVVVGDTKGGRVLDLTAVDASGRARPQVIADGFVEPHSVAFHDGRLYVGDAGSVVRFERMADGSWGDRTVIVADLPTGGDHTTRTVAFGADDTMYLSIGSSCNVCLEADERRATVMAFDLQGSNGRIVARGVRNAVGLTRRPGSDEMWMTNNGRDLLGDDLPPDTILVLRDGGEYGWPRCHSGRLIDPQFGRPGSCDGVVPPRVELQAHSAPLGLVFYEGSTFPAPYRGNLFVALHGSWNRSEPTGYTVVRIPVDAQGRPGPVQDFVTGFRSADGEVWARPVDLAVALDGALLVTDDKGGRVFRIAPQ